jgi:hypothetical protein
MDIVNVVTFVSPMHKHHDIKTYKGSGSKALCIDNLRIGWIQLVSFKIQPLYPREKSPGYPLNTSLGVSQNRSGRDGK